MSHGIYHRAAHKLRADRRQIFGPTATAFPPSPTPPPSANNPSPNQPNKPGNPNPPGKQSDPARPEPPTSSPNAIPTDPNPLPPTQQTTRTSAVLPVSASLTSSTTVISTTSSTISSSSTPSVFLTAPLIPTTSLTVSQPTFDISQPPIASFGPPSVTSAASPTTSHAASSGGMSTGTVVGIAAAGLAGLAVIGAVGVWAMKRYFRNDDDDMEPTPFSRHSWMRNSVALQDDDADAAISRGRDGPSPTPRPPTMIERKANLAGRGGFGQPNFQGGYNQYNDYPSQPYGQQYAPPMGGYIPDQQPYPPPGVYQGQQQYYNPIASQSPFEDPTQPSPVHQAQGSGAATPIYFSRQNSIQSAGTVDPVLSPFNARGGSIDNDGYATLDRTAVNATLGSPLPNPYNNQPFNDTRTASPLAIITDATAPASPKSPSFKAMPLSPSVVNVPDGLHEGRATPVQFGYSAAEQDAAQVISTPAAAVVKDGSAKRLSMSSRKSGRPETIYDEEDAYGGI